jgi:hypothetical protein
LKKFFPGSKNQRSGIGEKTHVFLKTGSGYFTAEVWQFLHIFLLKQVVKMQLNANGRVLTYKTVN